MTSARYKRVLGIQYNDCSSAAPTVSLKGEQKLADQIVKLAKRYRVPIVEKPDLIEALDSLEVDQAVPERLFEPVAIILAQLKRVFRRRSP